MNRQVNSAQNGVLPAWIGEGNIARRQHFARGGNDARVRHQSGTIGQEELANDVPALGGGGELGRATS